MTAAEWIVGLTVGILMGIAILGALDPELARAYIECYTFQGCKHG